MNWLFTPSFILVSLLTACGQHSTKTFDNSDQKNEKVIQLTAEKEIEVIITEDNLSALQTKVNQGLDINHRFEKGEQLLIDGRTILMATAQWKKLQILQWLVDINADQTIVDNKGNDVYYWAQGDPEVISILKGEKPLPLDESLLEAARQDDYRKVDKLILEGANPNYQNDKGETALILACDLEYKRTAGTLLRKANNINVNLRDHQNRTALSIALQKPKLQSIARLLKRMGAVE